MATETANREYICTLSEERLKQAEDELFETQEKRCECLKILREKIEAYPELNIRTDDGYLLRFLRAKKFDCDVAYKLLTRHFEVKCEEKSKQLFADMRPLAVKHMLEAGVTGVLPQRDKLGRKVLVFRPGRWDATKYPATDVFKTNFMSLSKLIQDEETQVTGIVLIADLKGVGFSHATHMTPFFAKRIASILQDSFPMRLKALHYVNEPVIFDVVFAVAKQFMKKKLLERIHVHGKNMMELVEVVGEENLPEEYGGKQPSFSNEDWKNLLLSCDDEFDEEAKYGIVKPEKEEKSQEETPPKQQEKSVLDF